MMGISREYLEELLEEKRQLRSRVEELEYELQIKDAMLKMIDKSHGEKIQRLDKLHVNLTTARKWLEDIKQVSAEFEKQSEKGALKAFAYLISDKATQALEAISNKEGK